MNLLYFKNFKYNCLKIIHKNQNFQYPMVHIHKYMSCLEKVVRWHFVKTNIGLETNLELVFGIGLVLVKPLLYVLSSSGITSSLLFSNHVNDIESRWFKMQHIIPLFKVSYEISDIFASSVYITVHTNYYRPRSGLSLTFYPKEVD